MILHVLFNFRCINEESAFHLKALINQFTHADQKFRGYLKTEFGDRNLFSGELLGKIWQKENPKEAMDRIFQRNGLEISNLSIVQYNKTTNGVSVIFESVDFETTVNVKKILAETKGLKTGICKMKLEHKKIRGGF